MPRLPGLKRRLALRGAIIWGVMGFSALLISRHLNPGLAYIGFVESLLYFIAGGAVLGLVYGVLLKRNWNMGERFRGSMDASVGRSQTVAEIFSFKWVVIFGGIIGVLIFWMFVSNTPVATTGDAIGLILLGPILGAVNGVLLMANSTGIVDRY